MTLKLRRKLQTTIQRITVDPLHFPGGREVCRNVFFFSAVLAAAVAGAETRFVRPVAYQQDSSEMGKAPIVRIDSVSEESEKVQLVSCAEPIDNSATNVSKCSGAASSKALKWVAVNSPEARKIQENLRGAGKGANSEVALDIGVKQVANRSAGSSLVTPIPSVMPRYSRVRLTSGNDESVGLDLNNLDALNISEPGKGVDASSVENADAIPAADKPFNMEDSADSLPDGADDPMISSGNSGEFTPVLPEADSVENGMTDLLEAPTVELDKNVEKSGNGPSESAIPGAIGNKKQESSLTQGGLNQDTQMPNQETEVLNQLPKAGSLNELTRRHRDLTESFTSRQVDVEDYDMPCESSEPMHRITEITNDIDLHDTKIVPKTCPLAPDDEYFPAREFAGTNFTWTASNLCHNPLYFEQPGVERYGHTIGPLQPVLSGAQFLATIPYLPMLMAIDPPNECQYALGYYRPGSCAPRKWSPIPYSMRGAIVEGGVATALVFLIP